MRIDNSNLEFVVPPIERSYDDYERESIALLEYLPKNYPIIELGGSIGVVACTFNRKLDDPTHHTVVEANPHLIHYLEKNKKINNCHFEIKNMIFSYGDGTFNIDKSFVSSSEKRNGSPSITEIIRVQPTSLGTLVQKPSVLICDIEGTEIDLFAREMDTVKKYIVFIHIEFHPRISGKFSVFMTLFKLKLNGFKIVKKIGYNYVFKNISLSK